MRDPRRAPSLAAIPEQQRTWTPNPNNRHTMNLRNKLALATMTLLASTPAWAVGVADTDVTGLIDDADATYTAVKAVGLPILGFLLALAIGVRIWKRTSKG